MSGVVELNKIRMKLWQKQKTQSELVALPTATIPPNMSI